MPQSKAAEIVQEIIKYSQNQQLRYNPSLSRIEEICQDQSQDLSEVKNPEGKKLTVAESKITI
jgi:hypothetical protein